MQRIQTPYAVPLLDRLVDENPHAGDESVPKRTCSAEDYKRSVLRDVLNLLNTRVSRSGWLEGGSIPTVLDYGLPDLGGRTAESPIDATQLEKQVSMAIRAFEPRLENIRVATVPLLESQSNVSVKRQYGRGVLHSANVMLGEASRTDFAGQDSAAKRFRIGLHIEADLKGFPGHMSLSFPVIFDSQDATFCVEEKSNGKS